MFLGAGPPVLGSPAHAGIDPRNIDGSVINERFPRTRGDRPVLTGYRIRNRVVPPHTRG